MRKALTAAVIVAATAVLAGCASNPADIARQGCIESATSQLPDGASDINTSKLETANLDEVMRELAENPLEPEPGASVTYSTAGDIWYRYGGKDKSKSVVCLVTLKDGKPTEPIEATVAN